MTRWWHRAEVASNVSALAVVGGLVILGLWQRHSQQKSSWRVWLVFAGLVFLLWLITKIGNPSRDRS